MTYLLPLNTNHTKICSEISARILDKALSDTTVSDVKKWTLSKRDYETAKVNTINNIAITAIACIAILFLPKIAVFGSVVVAAFFYHELAKMIENKEKDLLVSMRNQKTVKFLSFPNLNRQMVRTLKFFKNDSILKQMQPDLDSLEESPLKSILLEKYAKVLVEQEKINQKLESSIDLPSIIELVNESNNILKEMEEDLKALEGGSFFKQDLINANSNLLTSQKEFNQKLKTLQKNGLFFKENGALLNKIATFVVNTDLNIFKKARSCKNLIFYSLTATALIKAGLFCKQLNKDNRGIILNETTMLFLGVISVVYVAINVRELIAHRNDEEKKQKELVTITKVDKRKLNLLLQ